MERTREALAKTVNITAYDGETLVGCIRLLTDGYFFGTITELLVLPEYQGRGVGSRLLKLAKEHTPTMLYFGAQPGLESFYEKNGCKRSLQSFVIERARGGCLIERYFYSFPLCTKGTAVLNSEAFSSFSILWFWYIIDKGGIRHLRNFHLKVRILV